MKIIEATIGHRVGHVEIAAKNVIRAAQAFRLLDVKDADVPILVADMQACLDQVDNMSCQLDDMIARLREHVEGLLKIGVVETVMRDLNSFVASLFPKAPAGAPHPDSTPDDDEEEGENEPPDGEIEIEYDADRAPPPAAEVN